MQSVQGGPSSPVEKYLRRLEKGLLEPEELRAMLAKSGFTFNPGQMEQLMSAADVNGDGVVDFKQFVLVASTLLRGAETNGSGVPHRATKHAASKVCCRTDVALAARPLGSVLKIKAWNAYTVQQQTTYLQRLFAMADANGNGVLEPEELQQVLTMSGFAFSEEQVEALLNAADVNGDGVVEFEEFVPVATALLRGDEHQPNATTQRAQNNAPSPGRVKGASKGKGREAIARPPGKVDGELGCEANSAGGEDTVSEEVELKAMTAKVTANVVVQAAAETQLSASQDRVNPRASRADRGGARATVQSWDAYTAQQQITYLRRLFAMADANGNGVLEPEEMRGVLTRSGFAFSKEQVEALVSAADVNEDGVVDFEEFVPVAVSLLGGDRVCYNAAIPSQNEQVEQTEQSADEMLQEIFAIIDTNKDGVISKEEFQVAMSGKHKRELHALFSGTGVSWETLFHHMDANGDEYVDFEEFVQAANPEFWQGKGLEEAACVAGMNVDDAGSDVRGASTVRKAHTMRAVHEYPSSVVEQYLRRLFMLGDTNGNGVLEPEELMAMLAQSGFNFSEEQMEGLMSAADVNGDGVVDFEEFVPVAASLLCDEESIVNAALQKAPRPVPSKTDRSNSTSSARPAGSLPKLQAWTTYTAQQQTTYLRRLFAMADANGNGVLEPEEMQEVLKGSGFAFSKQQIDALVSAADVNGDGVVDFEEFVPVAVALLGGDRVCYNAAIPSQNEQVEQTEQSADEMLQEIFAIIDTNKDGVISKEEFQVAMSGKHKRELHALFSGTGVSWETLFHHMDANGDEYVDFEEFVQAANPEFWQGKGLEEAACVAGMNVDDAGSDVRGASTVRKAHTMRAVHEYPSSVVEQYLRRLFTLGDTNGNGVLEPEELMAMLAQSGFNFSEEQMEGLMSAADVNGDGVVDFEEFVPVASAFLCNTSAVGSDQSMKRLSWTEYSTAHKQQYLERLFALADANRNGVLEPDEMREVLRMSGFAFSEEQVEAMLNVADVNGDGVVEFEEFVPVALALLAEDGDGAPARGAGPSRSPNVADKHMHGGPWMHACIDGWMAGYGWGDRSMDGGAWMDLWMQAWMDGQVDGGAALRSIEAYSEEELEVYLRRLFEIGDKDKNGVLEVDEFKSLLELSGFEFTAKQTSALLNAADVNGDGVVDFQEFVPVARAFLKPEAVVQASQGGSLQTMSPTSYSNKHRELFLHQQTSVRQL